MPDPILSALFQRSVLPPVLPLLILSFSFRAVLFPVGLPPRSGALVLPGVVLLLVSSAHWLQFSIAKLASELAVPFVAHVVTCFVLPFIRSSICSAPSHSKFVARCFCIGYPEDDSALLPVRARLQFERDLVAIHCSVFVTFVCRSAACLARSPCLLHIAAAPVSLFFQFATESEHVHLDAFCPLSVQYRWFLNMNECTRVAKLTLVSDRPLFVRCWRDRRFVFASKNSQTKRATSQSKTMLPWAKG